MIFIVQFIIVFKEILVDTLCIAVVVLFLMEFLSVAFMLFENVVLQPCF